MTFLLRIAFTVACVMSACGNAGAETAGLEDFSTPVMGYLFDHGAKALRPVLGIPGASLVGDSLDVGIGLETAEISPQHAYALGTVAETSEVVLVNLEEGPLPAQPVAGTWPGPSTIVLSPAGTRAALFYRDQQRIQILTGLPRAPSVEAELDLAWLGLSVTTLALSDDGVVLLAAKESEGEAIYAVSVFGYHFVTQVARTAAIAFLQHSDDVLLTDVERNQLLLVRDVTGSPRIFQLAAESEGLLQPVAAAMASDPSRLFVVNSESGSVVSLSLIGAPPIEFPCGCRPTVLLPLRGNSVFLLTRSSEAPLFMFDASGEQPRILLVPFNNVSPAAPGASLPGGEEESLP